MDNTAVFIDTSFFKALIDEKDEFHKQAKVILEKLHKENATLITSNYTLDESFTLIRIKCGLAMVTQFRDYLALSSQVIKVIRTTVADEANAWEWFLKDWGKLSFTDCVSFAILHRVKVKKVATFDIHFQKAGFQVKK